MRKHLGVSKHPSVPLKLHTAAHQQSAYCNTSEEDTDFPALAAPKLKASKQKSKVQLPEMVEVGILKKEIAALQSQVAAIKTATHQEVREQAGMSDLQELKEQIVGLKAQVAVSGAQRYQSE